MSINQGRMTGGGGEGDCTVETKEQNGNNVIFRLIIDGDYHQNTVLFRKSVW